ncbi:MAG TPA: hypothetical protein VIK84_01690 [Haloplasmataceae bacterium]
MRGLISQLFLFLSNEKYNVLNQYICDDCFYTSLSNTIYGKEELIDYVKTKVNKRQIDQFKILNTLQEDKNTILITYNMLRKNHTEPLYGSAIIKMKDKKIFYVKNYIVNDDLININ